MSRTKKRSKTTPQNRRRSSRTRKKTAKGAYYDEFILETNNSFTVEKASNEEGVIVDKEDAEERPPEANINAGEADFDENFTQSTPSAITTTTSRREPDSPGG